MTDYHRNYDLFFEFLKTYAPVGFKGIDPHNQQIILLEKITEEGNQFFYVGDLIQMSVIYTSQRCLEMIGIEPEILTPYHFFGITHPDDIYRLSLGRAKLLKMAHDLFKEEKGFSILSTNFRMKKPGSDYSNFLIQLYLYYSTIPYKTVFVLKIHTNIDWYKMPKNSFHYYVGNDLSYFRYPDEELLKLSVPLSVREFEIIRLIESGLTSEEIAEKIFLSIHTVNTHRRNILAKTGKATMSELIYDLMNRGVL
jgi:DNA-binding CsgD family transcriptional regulator